MSAVFSSDRNYRYALSREWIGGDGTCLFVMLNPSTADAIKNDQTITRCINYARDWGYNRLAVGNIYAWRATKPRELFDVKDPVGPANTKWLSILAYEATEIVVAWGAYIGTRRQKTEQGLQAARTLGILGQGLKTLGLTKQGFPRHPSRAPRNLKPVPYP